MEIVSIIGMVAALCLLSFLVMKGVNIFTAAIASAFVVALTGGVGLYDAFQTDYMGGFTGFFGSNFLIFVAGALMGQVYEKTNGAKAIARLIISKLGKGAAMIAVPLAIGILTYGGIAGFVACFAVFPIALEVYREADIPRRFIPGVIVFACCTFSAGILTDGKKNRRSMPVKRPARPYSTVVNTGSKKPATPQNSAAGFFRA